MRLIEQKPETIPPEEFKLAPKVSLGMLGGSTPRELVAFAVETATELRNVINFQKFARRSMAQTRATSKACSLAFSWVMTLAGYEVTPAEAILKLYP